MQARATGWREALAVCCGNGYIVLQSSPESHYIKERAGVAQLVERGPEEPGVGGSTPSPGTKIAFTCVSSRVDRCASPR